MKIKQDSQYARILMEASLDPMVTISPEGKITEMNAAFEDIADVPRSKLSGSDFCDYFTDPKKAKEIYNEVFSKGFVRNFPLTIMDGKLTDVLFNGSVYKDESGKALGAVVVARDITEQKRNEKKTGSNTKFSDDIIQDLPVAIYTCDVNGYILNFNKAATALWGQVPEIGKDKWCGSFKIFQLDGKQIPLDESPLAIALKEGRSFIDHEIILERPDGLRRHVKSHPAPIFDSDGLIIGAVNLMEDITESKEDNTHIAHLAAIVEYSDDAIISKSLDGTINSWNKGAEKIFGYSAKEIIGKNIALIVPKEYFNEEKDILARIKDNQIIEHLETERIKKSGERIYVSLTVSPLKDNTGKIIGVAKILRDITEEKLASQYTRSLIEATLDPLVTIDVYGKITDVNEAMVKATDKTRENLIGTNFVSYFIEAEKAKDVYKEVFTKGFVLNQPLTIIDGVLTDVLINGSTYKDEKGKVMGAVVVARDITELKNIEKDLIEARVFAELATGIAEVAKTKADSARRIAEDAVKAKQQFLSNMSHEIRTPMNAIIGFTKVMLKTDLSSKQKEYLAAIKLSGDALIVLINDILDLAKVDAGKMTFEQIPFRMSLSISAMLHLFETKILEKNLELVKEYDTKIPDVLIGDPVRLHQIILNLVSNAVKFTTKGKITVSVRLLSEDEKKATIEFAITDTGIGITESKIEKIFENFQQASSGTSRLYGGTGLGLAIVKQLVEPQGGHIKVKSKLNEGSTFSFILSFEKTNSEAELETEMLELDTEIRNIKVLVVEDIALNQLLMKTLLDEFGFERDLAANGKIAIEKLKTKSFDIILMDLQMPEMNGFEATEYIRNTLHSKVPIIALTADVTTVDLAKCKAVGMNDYIAKPVDERLLYSKIISLVKKPVLIKNLVNKENDPIKKSKCIDLDYLIHRTRSNPILMMEMISLYLEQTPPLIKAMKKGLHDKDWNSLYSAVHKIIPSFSIMGISIDFENMAKKVQEYASTQIQDAGIPEMVLQIGNVCEQACKELEIEFNMIKNTNK